MTCFCQPICLEYSLKTSDTVIHVKMKPLCIFFYLLSSSAVLSQFRGQEPRSPAATEAIQQTSNSGVLFGFVNPENFTMSHSVSMGYSSVGREGLGLSMYTNSLHYQISEPLSVRADVSLVMTPFGSLSSRLGSSFGGIFLRNAEIDYRPSKDFSVRFQFTQDPYRNALSPYGNHYGLATGAFGGSGTDWP
jgi:hypothetical protein